MGIFTNALRNKKIRQILDRNTSLYFQSALLVIGPLTFFRKWSVQPWAYLMYVENLEMDNPLTWVPFSVVSG